MDLAMSDFNKAISLDENEVTSLANRAAIYGTRGDFQRSLADLNRALELDPKHNNALLNRGLVYFKLGNYAKCIEDYEVYLEYVPDNSNVVNTTGLAYLNMKDAENALPWFDRSIRMNNSNGAYYYNRSRAYATLTNKSAALQDALQARNLGYNVPQQYIELLK
jgi:tetratricopeptide (TPR) repeat protein